MANDRINGRDVIYQLSGADFETLFCALAKMEALLQLLMGHHNACCHPFLVYHSFWILNDLLDIGQGICDQAQCIK